MHKLHKALRNLYRRIPTEISYTFSWFFVTRIFLHFIIISTRHKAGLLQGNLESLQKSYLGWVQWDAGWYMDVAQKGYLVKGVSEGHPDVIGQANYAFFPLYPYLMRVANFFVHDMQLAGLIISNLAIIIALVYFYKWLRRDWSEDMARAGVKYALLFPTAFIFSAVMTESLFLMLMVITFYYSSANKWKHALIPAILLGLTRSVGIFILIPMFIQYARFNGFQFKPRSLISWQELKKLFKLNILSLTLVPMGFVVFMLFIANLSGKFFAVLTIQGEWGRALTNPVKVITRGLANDSLEVNFAALFTLVAIVVLVLFWKKFRIEYLIFSAILIILPLLTSSMPFHVLSMPRYLLVVLPLLMIPAFIEKRSKLLSDLIMVAFSLLQAALIAQWTLGGSLVV